MPQHDIIVIGASAGGVEALSMLVSGLPADLPAAVFVVLHLPPTAPSVLASILDRVGAMPVQTAREDAPIVTGTITVAQPDLHLLLTEDHMRLIRGPQENHHRPAIDALFRSAARAFGPRVIGVVLTGALNDGTAGLLAIKRRGGLAVVQDPATALFPSMPASACRYVDVDYRVSLAELPITLAHLATTPAPNEGAFPVSDDLILETDLVGLQPGVFDSDIRPGKISTYTCPECKGPLWEIQDGDLTRYRCRVGHAFTSESMVEGLSNAAEEALWVALNTLEESAHILKRLADSARARQHMHVVTDLERRAEEKRRHAHEIRSLLANSASLVNTDEISGENGGTTNSMQQPQKKPRKAQGGTPS